MNGADIRRSKTQICSRLGHHRHTEVSRPHRYRRVDWRAALGAKMALKSQIADDCQKNHQPATESLNNIDASQDVVTCYISLAAHPTSPIPIMFRKDSLSLRTFRCEHSLFQRAVDSKKDVRPYWSGGWDGTNNWTAEAAQIRGTNYEVYYPESTSDTIDEFLGLQLRD